ncbi:MAG: outer membrane beta-barrel protein, partial [Planctomycetota bacterium]
AEPAPNTPLHLYDADVNTFLLNSAHVAIEGSLSEEADYVVEIDFGTDALINSAQSLWRSLEPVDYGLNYVDLQEAYIEARSTSSMLGLRAGKFATYQGIEKIEAPDNPTISRGLLFTYAQPRTHTGAVVTYTAPEPDIKLALGLVNGWDMLVDDNDDQTFVANVQMTPIPDLDLKFTYMKGNEEVLTAPPPGATSDTYERTSIDVVAKLRLEYNTTVYLQYNTGTQADDPAVGDHDWTGYGVQVVYEPDADVTVGLRYESFEDEDDVRVGAFPPLGEPTAFAFPAGTGVGTYTNITFSLGFRLSGSTMLRLEIRKDEADWDAFVDDDGIATDEQTTLGLEFYCEF